MEEKIKEGGDGVGEGGRGVKGEEVMGGDLPAFPPALPFRPRLPFPFRAEAEGPRAHKQNI